MDFLRKHKMRVEADYEKKKSTTNELYIENKTNLEIYKKKLVVEESKIVLCDVKKKDIELCNEMNSYCDKYQNEFKSEQREVDDLILFFTTYISKYN